jgi:hypothetical protein
MTPPSSILYTVKKIAKFFALKLNSTKTKTRVPYLRLFLTVHNTVHIRVSDPYSFFPDSDPEVEAGDQYGSGSGSNPDPGL